jgi:uncharacterized membrane protein YdjX (TVP38/TMEM64 family)
MAMRRLMLDSARPSGVVVLAAVGQLAGGVLVLGWAYARADWLAGGGAGVLLTLVVLGLVGCGLALLPTHVLSLLCGWAFGVPVGLAVALLTATAASPIGYAVLGRLAGTGLGSGGGGLADRYPRAAAVCEAVARASPWRAGVLVGLLRLSPVVPYGSTNVLAAVFGVPLRPFVVGTLVGLAPRVLAVVWVGAGLERLASGGAVSPWLFGAGVLATVAALALIGRVTKRTLDRLVAGPGPAGH